MIFASFAHVMGTERRKLIKPEMVRGFRRVRNTMLVLAVLKGISIIPQFWQVELFGTPLRLYVWYVPLIAYWVGRATREDYFPEPTGAISTA